MILYYYVLAREQRASECTRPEQGRRHDSKDPYYYRVLGRQGGRRLFGPQHLPRAEMCEGPPATEGAARELRLIQRPYRAAHRGAAGSEFSQGPQRSRHVGDGQGGGRSRYGAFETGGGD